MVGNGGKASSYSHTCVLVVGTQVQGHAVDSPLYPHPRYPAHVHYNNILTLHLLLYY